MSAYTLYHIDAFTDTVFKGNPAAVCPLTKWLSTELMQAIASENNLSETAFIVGNDGDYHIRWFRSDREVDFCGHATLATAYVIFNYIELLTNEISFSTEKKGKLIATRTDNGITLTLPEILARPCAIPDYFNTGFSTPPTAVYRADHYMAIFDSAATLRQLQLNRDAFAPLDLPGIIATAPSDDPNIDIMSRFFTPTIPRIEDPVTGSAHCTLVPYWAMQLGKTTLRARQLSSRSGEIHCRLLDDRVELTGQAVPFLIGTIAL